MTGKNVLLALILSLILSFIGTVIYILSPLIMVIIRNDQGAGVGAASGGLQTFFISEAILFIIIFALLQWRSNKKPN